MGRALALGLLATKLVLSCGSPHVVRREEATPTSPPAPLSFGELLVHYWFVLVVVILFVVIAGVFLCACVFRFKRRSASQTIHHLTRSSPEGSHMPPDSLAMQHMVPEGIPLGMPTPIPSPQPSAGSSHRSYKRRRNGSGHVSSSSEETIRGPEYHSTVSLMSHSSGGGRPGRTESVSSGELRLKAHKRATSNPHIKVAHGEGVRSSMQSLDSVRSSRSSSQRTLVDVDVTVHLGADNDHETRKGIAAALAESARQLAQSAANFDQEDTFSVHSRRSQLSRRGSLQSRRKLFPNHTSQISLGTERGYSPNFERPPTVNFDRPPTASLDRPPTVSLDRPQALTLDRSSVLDRSRTMDRVSTSRKNSLSRAPAAESPLTITHSRRSLESPTNKLPAHMRPRRLHSLDDPLSQREISLDNLHHSPSPPHLFTARPILGEMTLDYSPEVLRTHYGVLEPVSPDSGMGHGTESSSSTLRSGGRRERLSRLSEKSIEYLNAEAVPEHRKAKVDSDSRLRRSSRNDQANDRTDSSSSASLDSTGYAPTGSASSVESSSRDEHTIPQFSYPLERLLSQQPLYYDIDCDDLADLGTARGSNGYTRPKTSRYQTCTVDV